jgi:hypothetical protein
VIDLERRIAQEIDAATNEQRRYPVRTTRDDGSPITVLQAAAALRMKAREIAARTGLPLWEAAKTSECHELLRTLMVAYAP